MTKRIYSLDVLRGLAIFLMILVDVVPLYFFAPLTHSEWAGMTPADAAFPLFVFAMGMSAAVSMARRVFSAKKIFFRALNLFLIGILFNMLPIICAVILRANFTASDFFEQGILQLRPFGILQRLALVYFLGIFLVRAAKSNVKILIAAFFLLAASSAGYHVYAPDNPFSQADNISGAIDKIFPGVNHIYMPTYDPEGLYGTLACTASFLFGFMCGKIVISDDLQKKFFHLVNFGVGFLILGGLWSFTDIISKNLWTTPYALINAGIDFLLIAALIKIFDAIPVTKKFFQPMCALGTNPLFFFLATNVGIIFLNELLSAAEISFVIVIYQATLEIFTGQTVGVVIICLLWCAFWLTLAEIFYRRGIVIKI